MKVTMSSICGSDMHPYAGRGVVLDDGITFGHEYTGVIVAVGDEVSRSYAPNYSVVKHHVMVMSIHNTNIYVSAYLAMLTCCSASKIAHGLLMLT